MKRGDLVRCGGYGRVLPEPQNRPTRAAESLSVRSITDAIPLKLRTPVRGIGHGRHRVLRTAVPKAAINKDRDPQSREDNVHMDEAVGDANAIVDAKAQASRVELLS